MSNNITAGNISATHINTTHINTTTLTTGNLVNSSLMLTNDVTAANVNAANVNATGDISAVNVNATSDVTANSISLNADNSVISFGADSEITLTHVADTGLMLKNTNNEDDNPVVLTLQSGETDIQINDIIGAIRFKAPHETDGNVANVICAGIEAVSESNFSSSDNATKLSFKTGSNNEASEKMSLSSGGDLTLGNLNISEDKITSTYNSGLDYQAGGSGSLRLLINDGYGGAQNNGLVFDDIHSWKIVKGSKGSSSGSLEFYFFDNQWNGKGFLTTGGGGQINFTGQHRTIMNTNISESFVGLIVSSTGKFVNTDNSLEVTINESLPICIFSNSDNDKKVFGVLSDKEDNKNTRSYSSGNWGSVYNKQNNNEQRVFINSLGEGAIWVSNKNGILENGDYISSSTVPGYGMKQSDLILYAYTVAKITCDCDFSTTKIVKQKLKVISTTDTSGNTITEIDYDANGDVQYEDDLDASGNQQMVYPLETRFLEADGTQITEEQYTDKLANGENVYIACFVGCTYHCG